MDIKNYILTRKKGLILVFIFFLLLVATLFFRKNIPYLFVFSILAVYLIILFSQLYNFENRIYFVFALILLIICAFLLAFNQEIIAEYSANYIYGFICLGIIGFFLDNLREKLRNIGKLKIYKFLMIFFVSLLIAFTILFYFNNFFISFRNLQLFFLRNKSEQKYNKDIKIYIDKPIDQQVVDNDFEIEGWAFDASSLKYSNNPGIDKIEIWLDGYPGKGKLLVENDLNKERSDLVPIYGKQFLKSGYLYKLYKADISKGKHIIFVFAHSIYIYTGWSCESVSFEMK